MVRSSLVLNSENKYIIEKLMMWVWCIINRQIAYVFTDACQ